MQRDMFAEYVVKLRASLFAQGAGQLAEEDRLLAELDKLWLAMSAADRAKTDRLTAGIARARIGWASGLSMLDCPRPIVSTNDSAISIRNIYSTTAEYADASRVKNLSVEFVRGGVELCSLGRNAWLNSEAGGARDTVRLLTGVASYA